MIDRGIPRLIKAVETITSLAGLFTIIAVLFGFTVLSVFIPWTGIKVAVIIALGGSLPFRVSLLKPHGEEDGFRTWSDFSYYISKGQQLVQDTISEQMKKVLNSGLRDPKLGILNAVRGGYFLDLHENQQFKMESMMTRMLKAKIISKS
ncbi:expressed protein [Phakopsora pachyrhizi]|uniref:Expressed protein n=1 Tax=Phakopsora pachyrhizi TaxID=170000 RepID=A0AAV0B5G5_PHAPC|nr:expressed protein [Phakopsora pachyrhizi]